jgi:hypothetical protein
MAPLRCMLGSVSLAISFKHSGQRQCRELDEVEVTLTSFMRVNGAARFKLEVRSKPNFTAKYG